MTPRPPSDRGAGKGGARRTPAGSGRPGQGGASKGKGGKAGQGSRPPQRRPQPPRATQPAVDVHDPEGVRLQKLLAQAGVASRRASEDLIAAGRVEVDGQVVTELGVRVDPEKAVIHVDGMRLQLDTTKVYLALNKPRGWSAR